MTVVNAVRKRDIARRKGGHKKEPPEDRRL